VTYRNTVDLATYFMGTHRLIWGDNERQTVGELEPEFIDGLEYKTVVYDVEPMEGEITGEIRVIYGESRRSLDQALETTLKVNMTTVTDKSQIEVIKVTYDIVRKEFVVEVENTGEVDTFVDIELIDVVVAGERFNFGADKVVFIKAGEKKKVRVKVELEEEDYEDNEEVKLVARYGEREQNLVRRLPPTGYKTLAVEYKRPEFVGYAIAGGVVILILLFLIILLKRRKKKCKNCKHMNKRSRKYCEKCGSELK
jgi:hypothetical protein